MLVQVTLENVLSFKEETTFSMVGVNSDLNHVHHLATEQAGKGRSLLPISALYGANAAGKSNLIKAIDFAKDLIVDGTRGVQTIPVSPFKLSDSNKKPSKFQFIFTYQGSLYSYGFKLNKTQIFEEWLYVTPKDKKREVLFFERLTNENKITEVEYGLSLKGRNSKYKQFLDFIAQGTRPNQLFLTEALDRNVETLKPVIDWFKNVLTIIPAESSYQGLELGILSSQEFTDFLRNFLKFADTGIDSIGTEEVEFNLDVILPDIPENMRKEILQEMLKASENSISMIESHLGKRYLLIKREEGQLSLIQLRTQHRDDQGVLIDFSMEEESEGTQRLINLIPLLFILQENPEKVIFLDELDRRLHPLLSRRFVEMALQCRNPNSQSQLIFTTHDTNLLDLELLRKDEIWFVEKNQQGASHLYSLAEFKISPDVKIEKGYFNGRFGAIPFFGDIRNLGWLKCQTEGSEKTAINHGKD
ncbi:ATP/GTP-binding protein [Planktothrix sp. FACHB-1365]|uniref:AAA family ATPase n=1 Tax=Planktothrix sp. FACHB-1365 TaxID=2692855 RepID=UPI001684EC71|nr:ATP/GTP-binding protein [Planktothrix sp. FACHB-1365]MBD2482363.1 AAA family ATPase [Planktothrix sp. FACHB-1365]